MGNENKHEQPIVSFQVITDTHVREQADHIHNRHLEKALEDIATYSHGSSGIMHVGDVTDRGLPQEYQELQRILETHSESLPEIRYTVGNHDIGAILWGDPPLNLTTMTQHEVGEVLGHSGDMGQVEAHDIEKPQNSISIEELWQKRLSDFTAITGMNGSYHDHWIDGYHYIFLGTEQPHPKDCDMSADQLQWLETKLSEQALPEQPIFVFLHQPLMDTVAGSMKEQGWYGVNQDAALKAVLSRYPQVILFSGHTHWQLEARRTMYEGGGQLPTMFNASSVAYLWTDEDEHLEGSESLHVDVYRDRVVVKGRNHVTGSWIEGAEYTVHYPVKVNGGN
ncbi:MULTISPECIES: metallophosphoesterase [Paenibacillus]|uniref:3',5'-cyclic AMP phosphodiesterase CpdA n=1 Tax=Paenibacillus pabuli TaxID=1472 RepID=A0ABX9BIN7_9BACL|nr:MULTISPECIES: metallophosphoesterase [Paenibacillus]QLG37776.1 metallophosphoesterase [Paenibacillus sp. E222]RAI94389.1 3',5'-cyclic AMP phosphodiesterase CpdA [Paenibacillus pabuli]SEO49522.1 3',5'-cyclic AMP phosphodiesterase CpdA [Paenibacillus sp. OK076]